MQRHQARRQESVEDALLDLAYELELPIVASNEPFFPTPDDFEAPRRADVYR